MRVRGLQKIDVKIHQNLKLLIKRQLRQKQNKTKNQKQQARYHWMKIFAKHMSENVSRTHKEFPLLNAFKTTQLQNGRHTWTDFSQRKTEMTNEHMREGSNHESSGTAGQHFNAVPSTPTRMAKIKQTDNIRF